MAIVIAILRLIAAATLGIFALFLAFIVWHDSDADHFQDSWESSQELRADFEKISKHTLEYRDTNGQFPNNDELDGWIAKQRFESVFFPENLSVLNLAVPGESCLKPDQKKLSAGAISKHRLCVWRGEAMEEYVIETSETTLPNSIEDYQMDFWAMVWTIVLTMLSLVGAWWIVKPVFSPRKAVP